MDSTLARIKDEKTILAIQDTSYICDKKHPKTKGLGLISKRAGLNNTIIKTDGLIMHTTFAVEGEGLPLGLLDQVIYARERSNNTSPAAKKLTNNNGLPIEENQSIKWLKAIRQTQQLTLKDIATLIFSFRCE